MSSSAQAAPVRIVLIGAGLIGKRHAKHLHEEPEADFVAIVEPFPAGQTVADQYGVKLFKTVDDLISSNIEYDAVLIATPNDSHVSLGVRFLESGKHVLVEKPIANTVEEGRKLVQAAAKSKGKVLVGHHRRFNPYIVQLKRILDANLLGRVLGVSGVWTALKNDSYFDVEWRKASGSGGPIAINLVHDLDLLRYLMGDVTRVFAEEGERTRGYEVEETGAVTLRFKSRAVGTFLFSDAAPSPLSFEGATGENPDLVGHYGKNVYTIFGTRGMVQLPDLVSYNYDHLDASVEKGWLQRLSIDETFAKVDASILPFTVQLKHFIAMCRQTEEPKCSAEEALKSLELLEAVRESTHSGKPVSIRS